MPSPSILRSLGLISSSSGDGVEAAVIDTDGQDRVQSLGGISLPYDERLRWRILEAMQNDLPTTEMLRLEKQITEHHLEAYRQLRTELKAEMESIRLAGFHGPIMRHMPSEGLTHELGNPWQLSEGLGLPVVSDFRRHDMAIGGEGAPLEAMYHWALMAKEPRPALMLELGSVASVTWLSSCNEIIAGTTGPGIGLLNEWVQEMSGVPHDLEGRIASKGKVDESLVREALAVPFFRRPLPKAADLHQFDHIDVAGLSVEDGAATLCAIAVEAFARAAKKLPELPRTIWVTGSGSRHPVICERLNNHFEAVKNVAQRDLNPLTMAAECFAWLAVRHVRSLPITTPETTGCRLAESAGFVTKPLND